MIYQRFYKLQLKLCLLSINYYTVLIYFLASLISLVEFIRNIDTYVKGFESSINKTFNDPNIAQTIIRFEKTFVNSLKSFSSKDFVELIALAGKTGTFCTNDSIKRSNITANFSASIKIYGQKKLH